MRGERFLSVGMGLAMLWMLVAIPIAAVLGDGPVFWAVTALLLGPFAVGALGLILLFIGALIFCNGEPDKLIDRLSR